MVYSISDIKLTLGRYLDDGEPLQDYAKDLIFYINKDWEEYESYSDDGYKRNLIFRNDDYELLLLCWKPGQSSPVHDHPPNGCLTKVLQGELTEKRYTSDTSGNLTLSSTSTLGTNKMTYIDNSIAYHSIGNEGSENAVSIHIYVPPNHKAKTYSI